MKLIFIMFIEFLRNLNKQIYEIKTTVNIQIAILNYEENISMNTYLLIPQH